MKQVFNLTVILSLIFSYNNCSAQTDSSKKKSYFKLNLNYLSNAVYFGRKDSAVVPYLRSSITYFDKSGFYAGTGVAMLVSPDEPKRIDLINVDAGYSFSIKKLDAGIYASKFFYSNASFAVGSELKGMIGAYAGYDLGVINVNVGGDILFSTNTDYSSSLGLSHPFESGEENKKWTITPTLQMNAVLNILMKHIMSLENLHLQLLPAIAEVVTVVVATVAEKERVIQTAAIAEVAAALPPPLLRR